MILLRGIKGQNDAVRYLFNSLSSGRIAHSYLFCGPEGVGRALCAKAFIVALICPDKSGEIEACGRCSSCRRVDALEHPDVLWIKPEKARSIKIEEIRKVKEVLSLKPYESRFSVCVIEDAHMMTSEASNALLKVLEEPPGRSLLILITDRKELLHETVVSRCAEVRFRPLPITDTEDIIMENSDLDGEAASFLAHFSQGSPGGALTKLNEGLLERKDDVIALVNDIVTEKNTVCLNWGEEDRVRLLEDLEMLIMFFRDITLGKEGLEEMVLDKHIIDTPMYRFFGSYSPGQICDIVERLIEMKLALERNVNPKLIAQALPATLK